MRKYQKAESYIRELIARGSLKPGNKVPSIRKLSRQLMLSSITVQHAYEILAAARVITARSRSGYYVAHQEKTTATRRPKIPSERVQTASVADIAYAMLSHWRKQNISGFGGINPHPEIFLTEEVHGFLRLVSRKAAVSRTCANPQEGNERLRMQIAERLVVRGVDVKPEDVVITNSGLQGFDLCLDMYVERGDTVLLDTPTYLPLVLSLQRRGLRVLEIFSHPINSIDPTQFTHLIANFKVKAIILSPLNHFPTGTSSRADTMAKLAQVIDHHDIPTIEVDLFSELSYQERVRRPLMADASSKRMVMFGNFLDVLGPDFNLGWVVGRGCTHQLMERKFLNNLMLGDDLLQDTLAEYIASGRYDKNARRLRRALSSRAEKGIQFLKRALPPGFTCSTPSGGYMCWVRGPSSFDAIKASIEALDLKISLAPGPMFSPSDGFHNSFGVNLSAPWMERDDAQMRDLFGLLKTTAAA